MSTTSDTFEGPPFEGPPDEPEVFVLFLRSVAEDIRAENWGLLEEDDASKLERVAAWIAERLAEQ